MFTFPLIFLHHVSKESLDSTPVITQGFTGAPAATGVNVNTQQVPCLLPAGWLACSLYAARVACVHGSGGRDDVGGLPNSSVVLSAGRTLSILLLLPTACFPLALQKWQLGYFGLCTFCPELPQLLIHVVIFGPI